jgi:sigma-E factor negative regulatory protein RseC
MHEVNKIEHTGIVQSVEDNFINVSIVSDSACVGCQASGICDVSESEEKVIRTLKSVDVSKGELVKVLMEKSLGYKALLIGYLLPFIIVIFLLIFLSSLSVPELTTGLVSLFSLVPYYLLVYLNKEKIGKKFSFTIKKLNT